MRLGICQDSVDRFAFAIHVDHEPARAYAEFGAGDLHASWTEGEDGSMNLELAGANAGVEEARRMFLERVENNIDASVEGAVMALTQPVTRGSLRGCEAICRATTSRWRLHSSRSWQRSEMTSSSTFRSRWPQRARNPSHGESCITPW